MGKRKEEKEQLYCAVRINTTIHTINLQTPKTGCDRSVEKEKDVSRFVGCAVESFFVWEWLVRKLKQEGGKFAPESKR